MTIECANSTIEATQNESFSSYFTVNSTYLNGVIVSSFNVTFNTTSNDTSIPTTNDTSTPTTNDTSTPTVNDTSNITSNACNYSY